MGVTVFLIVIISSLWVYLDAKKIGVESGQGKGFFSMGPVGWLLSCLLLWIVAFPAYLFKRRGYIKINEKNSREPEYNKNTIGSDVKEKRSDILEQLEKLAELNQSGVISQEEFNAAKKRIISG